MATTNQKRKRKKNRGIGRILPYILIILAAGVLIGIILKITTLNGIDDQEQNVVELDRTSAPVQTDNSEQTNARIGELIQRYLIARHDADVETLEKIVESDVPFDRSTLEMEAEYIEEFRNIQCYTIAGIVEHTYIVYVAYEQKFIGIETAAPSMHRFYICENGEGSLYINMLKQDGEVAAFMEEVSTWPEIRQLINDVNTKFQEACASDPQLQQFVDRLNNRSLKEGTSAKVQASEEAGGTEAASEEAGADLSAEP